MDEVAAAADVSRRTIYMYFPKVEQLLLEATQQQLIDLDVEGLIAATGGESDPRLRAEALIDALAHLARQQLTLGRRLIRLSDDSAPGAGPKRGFQRMDWIELAIAPIRPSLTEEQADRLLSGLAMIIGWEGMIALRDIRGLPAEREREVTIWAARSLIDAVLAE